MAVRALSFADYRGPDIAVRVAPQGEPELVLQANEFKPKRDVFTVRPDDWGRPWLSVQDLSCVHATTRCKLLAIFGEREMAGKPSRKAILRTLQFADFPEKNGLTPDSECASLSSDPTPPRAGPAPKWFLRVRKTGASGITLIDGFPTPVVMNPSLTLQIRLHDGPV